MTHGTKEGPLLPRRLLFGNPERTQVRLSPDGTRLSYLAPVDGVLNVWVASVGDLGAARPVTQDASRGVRTYDWAYSSEHVLYLQDVGGDENFHVFAADLTGGEVRDLTPVEGARAYIAKGSPNQPYHIVVALNDRDARYPDLYRVDVRSGERELILENPGFGGFLIDNAYTVRLAHQPTPDGGYRLLKRQDGGWHKEPLLSVDFEDSSATQPVELDATGETLYLLDSRGRDTAALVAVDTHNGELGVLHEDARANVTSVRLHPRTGFVQAVATEYLRTEWHTLDPDVAQDYEALREAVAGDFEVVSQSQDNRSWVVSADRDAAPRSYYRYDRDQRQVVRLFSEQPALEDAGLCEQQPVVIRSRDGLDLVSYLTLPQGAKQQNGRPASPLPMVLYVHGGPWGRDSWGYDAIGQWLANRGYAVLNVNFRGSTGFGKAFVNAGDLEWGGKMHDDLIDAVDWAVAEGIADEARVGIMGGSYGGYATLAGLAFTPEVFAVGVDLVGPSNLQTLLETIPAYWASGLEAMTRRMGDHRTEEGRAFLRSRSPLSRAKDIRKPLLIGQGANDPRVKQAESDQIVEALAKNGIPVTYLLYPDEGHGFARPENRLSFYAVAEGFLAAHLGGRAEPAGDDLGGSSMLVRAGSLEADI